METPVLIALLVAMVVAFFGWQWWSASGRRRTGSGHKAVAGIITGTNNGTERPLAPVVTMAPPSQEERYPEVVGQTEADLRAKEPDQRQPPAGAPRPQPVTADGKGPATIEDNLRHPEQAFHQPQALVQGPVPGVSVAAGLASAMSTPGFASTGPSTPPIGAHQQAFAPEMAQNGGALVGNSMFAFDGMAPTSFAEF